MRTTAMIGAAFVCCLATGASAAEVIQKGTVNAPADKVWATIGDFCGVKNWISIVTKCEISRKDAIDVSIDLGDWDLAEHHAAALEAFARFEPLP